MNEKAESLKADYQELVDNYAEAIKEEEGKIETLENEVKILNGRIHQAEANIDRFKDQQRRYERKIKILDKRIID